MTQAWQEEKHAEVFDTWASFNCSDLKRRFEDFNEMQLFLKHKENVSGKRFVEIACATGELYRYLRNFHAEITYQGFDVSDSAIRRAQDKYGDSNFSVCEEDLSDLEISGRPSFVWARDVVHHQRQPFEFLKKLLSLRGELTILRIRTRDQGESVVDSAISCQWQYNQWVPYIVLNTDELLTFICDTVPVRMIELVKSYQPLGGHNGRFLPKECYDPATGTAETAVCITRFKEEMRDSRQPEIVQVQRKDLVPFKRSIFSRAKAFIRSAP